MLKSEKDFARFHSKVNRGERDECWPWVGGKFRKGYGSFWMAGKNFRANRVAFATFYGFDPVGMQICHSCDRPDCVNPGHLWAGTNAENQRDSVRKGRHQAPDNKGERNGHSKLTADKVRKIRESVGVSQRDLGVRYGVARPTVSNILAGRRWSHI
jgi:DNA-binding XRE family transcriptional regulator